MKRKLISVLLCVFILICSTCGASGAAKQKHYLVLGDSIAYGSGLANPKEAVYGRIVADTNGYAYENYAVPGHTTENLLHRMEDEQVREAIRLADIINISIGGNNFLLGNLNGLLYDGIVKGSYGRLDEIADGFYTDLGKIVKVIRDLNPKAAILIQTLYNPQTGYVGEVYQQGCIRLNEKIHAFAKSNPGQILIAEVGKKLTDKEHDFASDRIHPSAAGNEKIAQVVLKTLFDHKLGSKTDPVIAVKGVDMRGTGMFTMFVNFYGSVFHLLAVIRNLFLKTG